MAGDPYQIIQRSRGTMPGWTAGAIVEYDDHDRTEDLGTGNRTVKR